MSDVVIIDAVRTPIGRRNGGLSTVHPADLLATVLAELIARTGIDPAEVGQVVGGCVSQVGEQSFDIARTAWLTAGLPMSVAATTVDTQCGSSQQATNLATALVAGGVVDVAVACGVESMSRIPIGANSSKKLGLGVPIPKSLLLPVRVHVAVRGRRAHRRQVGRVTAPTATSSACSSQQRAATAWEQGRFDGQVVTVDAPDVDEDGTPTGTTHTVARDEGLRETTLEKLATLKPVARENGVHTAGSASQISDGAAAVLRDERREGRRAGPDAPGQGRSTPASSASTPCSCSPARSTPRKHLLGRTGLSIDDIDVFEINEAFASVVLAWAKEVGADLDRTNPNGGAIALGHPLGATGAFLLTKALNELERSDGTNALVSMCCGGGLGTGTIIQRV